MKIVMAGATGFLGNSLVGELEAQGNTVVALGRKMFEDENKERLVEAIDGCDVVINLAGHSLLGRWTRGHKEAVYRSRVELTERLVEAINTAENLPRLFISASATGYYPSGRIFSERDTNNGNDYVAWLCKQWETAASQVVPQVRLAIIRISPVLSREGGMLSPLFRALGFKVSLKVGSAGNCFSWIHISDFIAAVSFIITNPNISGTINLSAPGITTNDYMAIILSEIMQAPVMIRVPSPLLSMAFGDSRHMISTSKAVYPAVLLENGFKFKFPYIKAALENIAKN